MGRGGRAGRRARAAGCSRAACGTATASRCCSRTRLEWILLDWAVMSIGAVVVGLYPTSSAKECEYMLEPLRGGARLRRGRRADTQARLHPRLAAGAAGDRPVRPAREARGGRAALAKHLQPEPVAGGRPRDADLHVRDDRAAEGLHAHAPQSRHGGDVRRRGARAARRRRASSSCRWPTATARLAHQAASASRRDGRARRRRRARARGARRPCKPTILPAVPRVYEKIHANALGGDRARGRHAHGGSGSGRSASARARAAPARRGSAVSGVARAATADRRPARLLEGARAARRTPAASASPAPRRSRPT